MNEVPDDLWHAEQLLRNLTQDPYVNDADEGFFDATEKPMELGVLSWYIGASIAVVTVSVGFLLSKTLSIALRETRLRVHPPIIVQSWDPA